MKEGIGGNKMSSEPGHLGDIGSKLSIILAYRDNVHHVDHLGMHKSDYNHYSYHLNLRAPGYCIEQIGSG